VIQVQNTRPVLTSNRLHNNGFGIRNQTPQPFIDALGHWWGHCQFDLAERGQAAFSRSSTPPFLSLACADEAKMNEPLTGDHG
jgi:hypothetical protein